MDPPWLLARAADQDVRVVVDDGKLASHANVDLIAHSSGIGPIESGDETSGIGVSAISVQIHQTSGISFGPPTSDVYGAMSSGMLEFTFAPATSPTRVPLRW